MTDLLFFLGGLLMGAFIAAAICIAWAFRIWSEDQEA